MRTNTFSASVAKSTAMQAGFLLGRTLGLVSISAAILLLAALPVMATEPELTEEERYQDVSIAATAKNAVSCTSTGNVVYCDGLFSELIDFSMNDVSGTIYYFVELDFKNEMITHSCNNTTYFTADSVTQAQFVNAFHIADSLGKTVRIKLNRNAITGDCNLNQFRIFYD